MSHQPQPRPRPRLIDTLPSHRTIPMKVIVLGLNCTGTMCTSPPPVSPLPPFHPKIPLSLHLTNLTHQSPHSPLHGAANPALPPLPRHRHVGGPSPKPDTVDGGDASEVYGRGRGVGAAGAGCRVGGFRRALPYLSRPPNLPICLTPSALRTIPPIKPPTPQHRPTQQSTFLTSKKKPGRPRPPRRLHGLGARHRLPHRQIHPDPPARQRLAGVHERHHLPRHALALLARAAAPGPLLRGALVGVQASHAAGLGRGRLRGRQHDADVCGAQRAGAQGGAAGAVVGV